MKRILIVVIISSVVSCGIGKRLLSIVDNKFDTLDCSSTIKFKDWDNSKLFILKVELKNENRITYVENGKEVVELSDYPLKSYKLLIEPEIDYTKQHITEELYLYLDNFEDGVNKGKALYMSSYPLKEETSKLMYNNDYFLSTYGINHVMTGSWEKEKNGELILIVKDKKNTLTLYGEVINRKMIEFTRVNHPKPLDKKDKSTILISDVLQVNPEKEEDKVKEVAKGIRFFKNKERIFVHPNWDSLGKNFDYSKHFDYYKKNYKKRRVIKIYIDEEKNNFYFRTYSTDSKNRELMFKNKK